MDKDKIINISEEIEKNLGSTDGELVENFVKILSLPDEEFNTIAPIFIDSLEKEMAMPENIIVSQQLFKKSGMSIKELRANTAEYFNKFDKEYLEILGKDKIDFLKKILFIYLNVIETNGHLAGRTVNIPIEICNEDAKVPTYARVGDAGLDVYSTEEVVLAPGEKHLFKTGIKVQIPIGYELEVVPKSGISLKTGLKVSNSPGTVDSGYRDEVGIIIENSEPPILNIAYHFEENKPIIDSILHGKSYTIEKGQKIAQLILREIPVVNFQVVNKIDSSENRGGGFGSTGLK